MPPKRLITSRLTGVGLLLPPLYSKAWAKGNAKVSPGHHFPPYGMPHTANVRVLIRSVLTYASKTWPLTLRDEEALGISERKILLCILGEIQENGSWRRSNLGLYKIYKQADIVKFVKLQRLKWAGHLAGMNENH
ncbi:uncharacterized protein TNCV_4453221 [Trichonephila clavipes]|nr:uncharacterized protein TNCV_4453221 [Trichonephila clavipes]